MKLTKMHELNFEQLKNRLQSVVQKLDKAGNIHKSIIDNSNIMRNISKLRTLLSAGDPRDCEDWAGHVLDQCVHQLQVDPEYLIFIVHRIKCRRKRFCRFEVRNNWSNLDEITIDDELEALTWISSFYTIANNVVVIVQRVRAGWAVQADLPPHAAEGDGGGPEAHHGIITPCTLHTLSSGYSSKKGCSFILIVSREAWCTGQLT